MNYSPPDSRRKQKERFTEACKQGLSISRICKELELSRSTAYKWRDLLEQFDDDWYAHSTRQRYVYTKTPGLEWNPERIEALSLQNPSLGCDRLAEILNDLGVLVSAPTVQSILSDLGLRTITDREVRLRTMRWAALESGGPELTDEQENFLDKVIKPVLQFSRNGTPIGERPGENLIHGWFDVGPILPDTFINIIVDGFDCSTFEYLSDKTDDGLVDSVRTVISGYARDGYSVRRIYTTLPGERGWNHDNPQYQEFLQDRDIELITQQLEGDGYILRGRLDRIWEAIEKKFFGANAKQFIDGKASLAEVEETLSAWLEEYGLSPRSLTSS